MMNKQISQTNKNQLSDSDFSNDYAERFQFKFNSSIFKADFYSDDGTIIAFYLSLIFFVIGLIGLLIGDSIGLPELSYCVHQAL